MQPVCFYRLFFFIVKHTVAVALKIRVFYLLAEFLAHAFEFFGPLSAAGAVAAGFFKTRFHCINNLLIGVESDFHKPSPLFICDFLRKVGSSLEVVCVGSAFV